jgi:hypothetical protein
MNIANLNDPISVHFSEGVQLVGVSLWEIVLYMCNICDQSNLTQSMRLDKDEPLSVMIYFT